LKLCDDVRKTIKEISIPNAKERLAANPKAVLIDVREESEWANGHIKGSAHLGKGVLERDIETRYPDKS
jgi:rhodanese-related sulfurtransferase